MLARRSPHDAPCGASAQGDWIKPGAVVIDVGVNSKPDPSSPKGYQLCGDVDFAEAVKVPAAPPPV